MGFSTKLKAFREGRLKLEAVDCNRKAEGKFKDVEEKLVACIRLRAKAHTKDKTGLSWLFLKEKAAIHAEQLGCSDQFKASSGWLDNVLKRSGTVGINLHGEAMDMDPEKRIEIISKWKEEQFHPLVDKHNIPP